MLAVLEHKIDALARTPTGAPRRVLLDRLVAALVVGPRALVFVCTHNSRRSQLSQAWAAAAAHRHGVDAACFSGGTEVTAFHPSAVAALARAGFEVERPGGANPRYRIRFAAEAPPAIGYSKRYDDAANPTEGFVAVMTCAEADAACPIVDGARVRIPLRYEDPKVADGTPQEQATYDARSDQIAAELGYVFERVAAALATT